MIEFICGIAAGIVLTKKLKVLEKVKLPNIPKLPKYKVIVKVGDKYAIRRGYYPYYEYKDLTDRYWWLQNRRDVYCLGSKEQIKKLFCTVAAQEVVVDL